jgi:beta-lactamase class D
MKVSKVVIAVLACSCFLFAQEAAPAGQAKMAKKAAGMKIWGKVVSADVAANTVIVREKNADDTVSIDSTTKIMSGKNAIGLGDLMTDAMVTVAWKKMGDMKMATKIVVKEAAAPAKTN